MRVANYTTILFHYISKHYVNCYLMKMVDVKLGN